MLLMRYAMLSECAFVLGVILPLFSDAEAGEDGGEDLGGGDVAGDGGEVVDGGSERLGDEVGGEVGVNGLDYFLG